MRIITVSREFGSGGREVGKRLADALGFDYYDKEIITTIAKNSGMNEKFVENMLDGHAYSSTFAFTFRHSFGMPVYTETDQISLLLEQKRVIEKIATQGKDFVIVGRNSDLVLEQYRPLNIFVCSDMESKLERCRRYAEKHEKLTDKEIKANMKRIDRNRAKTRDILAGGGWGDRQNYDLIVNTGGSEIKKIAPALAEYAKAWFEGREE